MRRLGGNRPMWLWPIVDMPPPLGLDAEAVAVPGLDP
jgi:hypothetical protein